MQRDQLIAATEEKVVMLTDVVEHSITTTMREGRVHDIQGIIEAVGKNPDLEKVWMFNNEGIIRFSSVKDEIGLKIEPERFARYMAQAPGTVFLDMEEGKQVHAIVKPILKWPECSSHHNPKQKFTGFLHIDLSFAKAKAQIASIHKFVLFSAILTIASLSIALWVLLSRLVSCPVSTLIRTMGKAERGDLSTRVKVKSRDELGQLGENFNYMIKSLQEAERKLEAEH